MIVKERGAETQDVEGDDGKGEQGDEEERGELMVAQRWDEDRSATLMEVALHTASQRDAHISTEGSSTPAE